MGKEKEEVAIYEELEEITTKKRKLGKNPHEDTSFLLTPKRRIGSGRATQQEWEVKQKKIKSEDTEITFSYWDGSGHWQTVNERRQHHAAVPAEGT